MQVCETVNDVISQLEHDKRLITVKSRIFFEILERKGFQDILQIYFPPTGIGTATVFELTVMSAILKIINPRKITEIGTFTGYSTAAIALNSSDDAVLISIDLPKTEMDTSEEQISRQDLLLDWRRNDNFLRDYQNQHGELYIERLPDGCKKKIRLVKCDSTKLLPIHLRAIEGSDFFFIDGGHSKDIVSCDTETALRSISETGWILWHDYGSKTHVEVTQYINDLVVDSRQVLHVENTMLAIHSPDFLNFFRGYAA
jgi:hypothetical protein